MKDRNNWIKNVNELKNNLFLSEEDGKVDVAEGFRWIEDRRAKGIKTYINIFHDESSINKYAKKKFGWFSKDVRPFMGKSEGQSFNISEFIIELDGCLRVGDEYARIIHKIGGENTKDKYYWTNDKFLVQVEHALKIFHKKFNLKTPQDKATIVPVFHFDNASVHRKASPTAPDVDLIRKKDGSTTQPIFEETTYMNDDGEMEIQSFYKEDENGNIIAKGLVSILSERGYEVSGLNVEELRYLLRCESDFQMDLKPMVQNYLEDHNALCYFIPKFHCELNPIELLWAHAKQNFKKNQTGAKMKSAEVIEKVNASLDSVPVSSIRKFFHRCRRIANLYEEGFGTGQIHTELKKLKKIKKSHRKVQL